MNSVILLLALQGALGAADNVWHHEIKVALPRKASARRELALHALRSLIYAPVFMMIAWLSLHGGLVGCSSRC